MAKQDDGLFLLEVLIDKIIFVKSPCFSDKNFRTCVNVEAPAVEPLEICDDDPGASVPKTDGPFVKTFNVGKSCLFSLKETDISAAMSKYPIKIFVYKCLPCGCLPSKIVMGDATIDMTKEFVHARKKFLKDPETVSYQALKDSFRITGPDGGDNGEILMFLRISCFGKLITTKFHGVGGPPNLGAAGGSKIVDRSCNPRRDFQSVQDPCACGTARTAGAGTQAVKGPPCMASGGGVSAGSPCPIARDPYNGMPCEDPDDPCYCSGPKPAVKQQMICRNTDQYCLHMPKGTFLRLPFYQELSEDEIRNIKGSNSSSKYNAQECVMKNCKLSYKDSQVNVIVKETLHILFENLKLPVKSRESESIITYCTSISSMSTQRSKRRSVSFSDSVDFIAKPRSSYSSVRSEWSTRTSIFSNKETTVYMTLFDEFCYNRTSGTQATASINKCLQVATERNVPLCSRGRHDTELDSPAPTLTTHSQRGVRGVLRPSNVYFFGRKPGPCKSGMGSSDSKTRLRKQENITSTPVKSEHPRTSESAGVQAKSQSSSAGAQTNVGRGALASTYTNKAVSIKDCKNETCPAVMGNTIEDMMATVSHIRIGPSQPCPMHGRDPCQGPKCIIASSEQEQQAPVKVSTVNNPRRGVFELVIRRMTGAPLAKNELMLEWTPPQLRQSPFSGPCTIPCTHPTCRPSKSRMVVCRPSLCKPKCYRKTCKKPCVQPSCCPPLYKKICRASCSKKTCRLSKPCPPSSRCKPCLTSPRCRRSPCPPPRCKPCPPPTRCGLPCIPSPCCSTCVSCCGSSPCLRLCPVGRRKARKAHSQPRMKPRKKRISPCYNRSSSCSVVRCRSVVGPCFAPCPPSPSCLSRKSCSVFPFKPICSKSICSSFCG